MYISLQLFTVYNPRLLAPRRLLLRDAGLLDEKMLEQISDYMVISVLSPPGRRWWSDTVFVAPEVREYIDSRLATATGLPTMGEAMPHWMSMGKSRSTQS